MADDTGKIHLDVVTPTGLLLSTDADMVVVPGAEGDFGVLTGHAPMISSVRPGTVVVFEGDKSIHSVFVAGGFAEVTGERCTVLAEEAQAVADIDRGQAEDRLKKALEAQAADAEHVDGKDGDAVVAAKALVAAAGG